MPKTDNADEVARLRAELDNANQKYQSLQNSLRFQIGDLIVSIFSTRLNLVEGFSGLVELIRRARMLRWTIRIQRELFSGLPGNGLPLQDQQFTIREAKDVHRYLRSNGAGSDRVQRVCEKSKSPWLQAACQLALEFSALSQNGMLKRTTPLKLQSPPRRVLYVTQHDPVSKINGYTRRTSAITQELAARGYSVACITPPKQDDPASDRNAMCDGIAYRLTGTALFNKQGLRSYVEVLATAIEKAAHDHQADTIHSASNYINGLASLIAARKLEIPCVYEVRGLWEETRRAMDSSFGETLGYRVQSQLEAHCAKMADALVVGCAEIGEELTVRGVDRNMFIAQSGAPEIAPVSEDTRRVTRKKFGVPDQPLIGFIGSITAYEGLEVLLRALQSADLRHVNCLIVGDGPHLKAVRHAVARNGLADRVKLAGRLPFVDAVAALSAVDLCVYPRIRSRVTEMVEALKPLEALASGVPVIVSDVAPMRRLAESCPSVTSTPAGNHADLAAAINAFFQKSHEERQELGETARSWIEHNRRWSTTTDVIERAYQSLVASPDTAR